MKSLQEHLRKTFLAGIFAAVPLAVTGFIIWYVDAKTRIISEKVVGVSVPFLGVLIALAFIYLAGLVATTLLGKFVLRLVDALLIRVPGLREIYAAWKQIALTPGGTEGVFSRVVVIPDETGATHLLGFTSGRSIEGDDKTLCVFVPAAPNPMNGRLYFVHREKCQLIDLSTEEAFKVVLSTGNYVPAAVGKGLRLMPPGKSVHDSAPVGSSE
jgi:uncharacterized membrane protein